ncbi:MAG: DUF3617 domain-containing protein [Pseudomonadota bacterium]
MTKTKFAAVATLTASIVLAACSEGTVDADSDGDGTVTAAEVGAVVSDMRPEAGKYSVTMNLVKAEIPGAPQEMLDAMGGLMNRTFEYCLTPEEADKGFEESLTEGQDENCTIEKFELTGNDVDMAMSCSGEQQGNMRMTMTGTVSPTQSDISVVTTGTLPQIGEANMEMTMQQERLGDCDG